MSNEWEAEDVLGVRYILSYDKINNASHVIESRSFSTDMAAKQFLNQLQVDDGFCARLLRGAPFSSSMTVQTKADSVAQVAKMLAQGRLSAYVKTLVEKERALKQHITHDQSGARYGFIMTPPLKNRIQQQSDAFRDTAKALDVLQTLTLAQDAWLTILSILGEASTSGASYKPNISSSLGVNPANAQRQPSEAMQSIAQLLVDKKLFLVRLDHGIQVKIEPAAVAPAKAAKAPPPQRAKKFDDKQDNTDPQAQADALKEAAEEGKPFCEACEKHKQEQATAG